MGSAGPFSPLNKALLNIEAAVCADDITDPCETVRRELASTLTTMVLHDGSCLTEFPLCCTWWTTFANGLPEGFSSNIEAVAPGAPSVPEASTSEPDRWGEQLRQLVLGYLPREWIYRASNAELGVESLDIGWATDLRLPRLDRTSELWFFRGELPARDGGRRHLWTALAPKSTEEAQTSPETLGLKQRLVGEFFEPLFAWCASVCTGCLRCDAARLVSVQTPPSRRGQGQRRQTASLESVLLTLRREISQIVALDRCTRHLGAPQDKKPTIRQHVVFNRPVLLNRDFQPTLGFQYVFDADQHAQLRGTDPRAFDEKTDLSSSTTSVTGAVSLDGTRVDLAENGVTDLERVIEDVITLTGRREDRRVTRDTSDWEHERTCLLEKLGEASKALDKQILETTLERRRRLFAFLNECRNRLISAYTQQKGVLDQVRELAQAGALGERLVETTLWHDQVLLIDPLFRRNLPDVVNESLVTHPMSPYYEIVRLAAAVSRRPPELYDPVVMRIEYAILPRRMVLLPMYDGRVPLLMCGIDFDWAGPAMPAIASLLRKRGGNILSAVVTDRLATESARLAAASARGDARELADETAAGIRNLVWIFSSDKARTCEVQAEFRSPDTPVGVTTLIERPPIDLTSWERSGRRALIVAHEPPERQVDDAHLQEVETVLDLHWTLIRQEVSTRAMVERDAEARGQRVLRMQQAHAMGNELSHISNLADSAASALVALGHELSRGGMGLNIAMAENLMRRSGRAATQAWEINNAILSADQGAVSLEAGPTLGKDVCLVVQEKVWEAIGRAFSTLLQRGLPENGDSNELYTSSLVRLFGSENSAQDVANEWRRAWRTYSGSDPDSADVLSALASRFLGESTADLTCDFDDAQLFGTTTGVRLLQVWLREAALNALKHYAPLPSHTGRGRLSFTTRADQSGIRLAFENSCESPTGERVRDPESLTGHWGLAFLTETAPKLWPHARCTVHFDGGVFRIDVRREITAEGP